MVQNSHWNATWYDGTHSTHTTHLLHEMQTSQNCHLALYQLYKTSVRVRVSFRVRVRFRVRFKVRFNDTGEVNAWLWLE